MVVLRSILPSSIGTTAHCVLWPVEQCLSITQIHTKHITTLCGQNVELYIKTQSVPRSKHTPSRL